MDDVAALVEHLSGYQWVDLSHTLEEAIPAWPTHARFGRVLHESYEYGDAALHYGLTMSDHTGTHMDAPLHFVREGPARYGTDEIPLQRLVCRAATVEAPDLGAGDLLAADYLRGWESEHGSLAPGDAVLIRYGWDVRWKAGPVGRRFLEDWPGLSGKAAEYLVEKGISLVGCDTLAIDAGDTEDNPAHHALLGNEVYVVENLKTWTCYRRSHCSWRYHSRSGAVRDLRFGPSRSCLMGRLKDSGDHRHNRADQPSLGRVER